MSDLPWQGDACSLVDAFRKGERSPAEELRATFSAIERSSLNAFSYLEPESALAAAQTADVQLPFGGVPMGIKELQDVVGWPATEASLPLKGHRANHDGTMISRLRNAGAVLAGLTTASEFGGVNLTRTVLNGATHNPWQHGRTPGGSSGGAAAAVAGGIITVGTAGDGGGSTRIPAGFCGLVGLKGTYGRIPKGPSASIGNLTAVSGSVNRSVRDAARFLDVTNGHDSYDPLSLPRVEGYEAGLGSYADQLRGKRVAVLWDFGGAYVVPSSITQIQPMVDTLARTFHWHAVDVECKLPNMGTAWSLSGMLDIISALGDAWPACADDLTPEMRFGLQWAEGKWNADAANRVHKRRIEHNDAMAEIFSQVDLVLTATNPDVAFDAQGPLPSVFGGKEVGGWNNGRLTAPSNLYGNPAISIPAGCVDGLPVGLQVIARHHQEPLLLDVAFAVERLQPWPLVAPSSPA
jgi:aspartyl-tRNA(Asn)/glutamyl-tRNA(Gln) amidotransferase subunit A